MHGNLRNMLISTDQSQRVSQPVSQITLSHFRISQITHSRGPHTIAQRPAVNNTIYLLCVIDDIEEWSGCSYIQLKEMSQDREQWRRKTIEWSSAVANRHRRWSTSE